MSNAIAEQKQFSQADHSSVENTVGALFEINPLSAVSVVVALKAVSAELLSSHERGDLASVVVARVIENIQKFDTYRRDQATEACNDSFLGTLNALAEKHDADVKTGTPEAISRRTKALELVVCAAMQAAGRRALFPQNKMNATSVAHVMRDMVVALGHDIHSPSRMKQEGLCSSSHSFVWGVMTENQVCQCDRHYVSCLMQSMDPSKLPSAFFTSFAAALRKTKPQDLPLLKDNYKSDGVACDDSLTPVSMMDTNRRFFRGYAVLSDCAALMKRIANIRLPDQYEDAGFGRTFQEAAQKCTREMHADLSFLVCNQLVDFKFIDPVLAQMLTIERKLNFSTQVKGQATQVPSKTSKLSIRGSRSAAPSF